MRHAVEFTLRRQDDIIVGDRPRQLSVVLDESILHREIGDQAVLRDQLIRLLNLSTLAHIDLRVVPFSAGRPDLPGSPFAVLTMPSPFPYTEVGVG